jgi:hypothetical protein
MGTAAMSGCIHTRTHLRRVVVLKVDKGSVAIQVHRGFDHARAHLGHKAAAATCHVIASNLTAQLLDIIRGRSRLQRKLDV